MSTTIGLFEDPRHVDSVVDALEEAGFEKQDVQMLGQEYITPEADLAIRYKRASDILGIIGVLVGGLAGMMVSAGVGELLRYVLQSEIGITGIVLLLFTGAAVGAVAGALAGTLLIPSLMSKFGVLTNNHSSSDENFNKNGLLVAVNTNEANTNTVADIMRSKKVVNVETRPELGLPVSPQTV